MQKLTGFAGTVLASAMLAACVSAPPPIPPAPSPPPAAQGTIIGTPPAQPAAPPPRAQLPEAEVMREPGLEGVIFANDVNLIGQFGTPRLDVREGDARKLQFAGAPCVLDIFLYPPAQGGEPIATWVEARRASDGAAVDRAACVAALRR